MHRNKQDVQTLNIYANTYRKVYSNIKCFSKSNAVFSGINLDSKNKMCFVEMNNKIVTPGFKKKPDASHMCARIKFTHIR
jgi:hypothetical protein